MKHILKKLNTILQSAVMCSLLIMSGQAMSQTQLIDDFNHETNNNVGQPRVYMNDTMSGGSTATEHALSNGVLHVSGDIVPPRGQPGWASTVLPLVPMGESIDASAHTGIQLRVKISKGNLTVSANSNDITNFDYHAAPVVVTADGNFHEVKIPFDSMKRGWSLQTELNTKNLNSLSVVAYSLQNASFDFEIAEVSFY